MTSSRYPLRLRNQGVRELVRIVAEREGISQNELLEQAAEHEVVARGALLVEELEASAAQLRGATSDAIDALVDKSLDLFAEGEGLAEPLTPRRVSRHPEPAGSPVGSSRLEAIAAFQRR